MCCIASGRGTKVLQFNSNSALAFQIIKTVITVNADVHLKS